MGNSNANLVACTLVASRISWLVEQNSNSLANVQVVFEQEVFNSASVLHGAHLRSLLVEHWGLEVPNVGAAHGQEACQNVQ